MTEERPVCFRGDRRTARDPWLSVKADRSRNNQLLLAALAQIEPQVHAAVSRYGKDRVAVIMGTSTSALPKVKRRCAICTGMGNFRRAMITSNRNC